MIHLLTKAVQLLQTKLKYRPIPNGDYSYETAVLCMGF